MMDGNELLKQRRYEVWDEWLKANSPLLLNALTSSTKAVYDVMADFENVWNVERESILQSGTIEDMVAELKAVHVAFWDRVKEKGRDPETRYLWSNTPWSISYSDNPNWQRTLSPDVPKHLEPLRKLYEAWLEGEFFGQWVDCMKELDYRLVRIGWDNRYIRPNDEPNGNDLAVANKMARDHYARYGVRLYGGGHD